MKTCSGPPTPRFLAWISGVCIGQTRGADWEGAEQGNTGARGPVGPVVVMGRVGLRRDGAVNVGGGDAGEDTEEEAQGRPLHLRGAVPGGREGAGEVGRHRVQRGEGRRRQHRQERRVRGKGEGRVSPPPPLSSDRNYMTGADCLAVKTPGKASRGGPQHPPPERPPDPGQDARALRSQTVCGRLSF